MWYNLSMGTTGIKVNIITRQIPYTPFPADSFEATVARQRIQIKYISMSSNHVQLSFVTLFFGGLLTKIKKNILNAKYYHAIFYKEYFLASGNCGSEL